MGATLQDRWNRLNARLQPLGISFACPCPEAAGPLQLGWLDHIEMAACAGPDAPPDAPVAADPASLALLQMASRAAATQATVLIGGPTGAGKEVLARHIHRQSPRAAQPFVAINSAALPDAMLEALLFGHERGAFTGAAGAATGLFRAADGGTLFLDEIAEMPLALQAKLLRALQEREVLPLGATRPVPVDVRIVAASNRDLAGLAAAGQFRADLHWRLAVFPLHLLPLAARPADIVPLAAALMLRLSITSRCLLPVPTEAALHQLLQHCWPGNVRELDNVLQRAAILATEGQIDAAALLFQRTTPAGALHDPVPAHPESAFGTGLAGAVRTREAETIQTALAASGGQRLAAAARLGISERTLRYKLAALAGKPRTGKQGIGKHGASSHAPAGASLQ